MMDEKNTTNENTNNGRTAAEAPISAPAFTAAEREKVIQEIIDNMVKLGMVKLID